MINTQTNETLQTFEVYRDGELDPELTPQPPTLADNMLSGLQSAVEALRLQGRMYVYDKFHQTNYRSIRNALVREKRNREHEAALGLERVK